MEALVLLLFVSLTLAACAVGFFVWNVLQQNQDHTDRLSILPLDRPTSHATPTTHFGDHTQAAATKGEENGNGTNHLQ